MPGKCNPLRNWVRSPTEWNETGGTKSRLAKDSLFYRTQERPTGKVGGIGLSFSFGPLPRGWLLLGKGIKVSILRFEFPTR